MARLPRVVIVDVPPHVAQRGNARQVIFSGNSDRLAYLELLRQHCELYRLSLLGYCLMSNHVHLVVVPRTVQALAQALQHSHGRYAAYWNARQSSSGHVWQGRFYSCPLDDAHLWTALRYVELNPVRAGIVDAASQWRWSSAAAHCGVTTCLCRIVRMGSVPSVPELAVPNWPSPNCPSPNCPRICPQGMRGFARDGEKAPFLAFVCEKWERCNDTDTSPAPASAP